MWSRRAPTCVYLAAAAVAMPLYLALRSPSWFAFDDWDPLTSRVAWRWHDLVRPHFDHLIALPVLLDRAMLNIFGLDSRPFQLVTILAHIVVGWQLLQLVRRSGADQFVAAAIAVAFLFFAAGHQDITYAFGISFTGALVFGMVQMRIADRDGPLGALDLLAAAAGIAAIACSAVGLSLQVAVVITAVARRGWRVGVVHVVPALTVYTLWFLTQNGGRHPLAGASTVWRFTRVHVGGLFSSLGGGPVLGVLIAALWVLGIVSVVREADPARRRALIASTSLSASAVVYLITTGLARRPVAWLPFVWPAPRHLHVLAVFVLPLVARGATIVAKHGRAPRVLLVGLLLVGAPLSVLKLHHDRVGLAAGLSNAELMVTAARLQGVDRLPRDTPIDPILSPGVTIGWLLDQLEQGRLPLAPATTPDTRAEIARNLMLGSASYDGVPLENCRTVSVSATVTLQRGDELAVLNAPALWKLSWEDTWSSPAQLSAAPFFPGLLDARSGPLEIQLAVAEPGHAFDLCVRRGHGDSGA